MALKSTDFTNSLTIPEEYQILQHIINNINTIQVLAQHISFLYNNVREMIIYPIKLQPIL